MASNDAWRAGVDIAQGKGRKKKDDDDSSTSSKSDTAKPVGGLLGLASGAMKAPKARSTLRKAQWGQSGLDTQQPTTSALIPSYKRGGRVKRTGLAFLHSGEFVVPAKHRSRKPSLRKVSIKA